MNLTNQGKLVQIPPGKYLQTDSKNFIEFEESKVGLVVKDYYSPPPTGLLLLIEGDRVLVWGDQIKKQQESKKL
jgi:hypothetical protein|tara:strand:- start:1078 stop:1299 length:222 start_codon:yes stop_codon:yes gene_type:complete